MSTDSSNTDPVTTRQQVPWNPFWAVFFVLIVFYFSQIVASLALSFYTSLQHWSRAQALDWMNDSVVAQFAFVLIAEALAIGAVYLFIRQYRQGWSSIGLHRPKWSDVAWGFTAVPVYYLLFFAAVSAVAVLYPGLNVNQEQQIGFGNVHGSLELVLTFISLAVLPPLAEEIMVRGFLYSSIKKVLPGIGAVLATSAVFAAAHLPEGGAAGLLWIGFIDTFMLSLVLIYLREKTGSLWASITLHAIKNSVAFFALFVFGGR